MISDDSQKQERRQKILENRMRRQGLTALAQNQLTGSSGMYDDRCESPDGIDPRLGYVTRHTVDEVVMVPAMVQNSAGMGMAGLPMPGSHGAPHGSHASSITPPTLHTPPLQTTPPLPWVAPPPLQHLPSGDKKIYSDAKSYPQVSDTKIYSQGGEPKSYSDTKMYPQGLYPATYPSVASQRLSEHEKSPPAQSYTKSPPTQSCGIASSSPSSLSPEASSHGTPVVSPTDSGVFLQESSATSSSEPLVAPVDTKLYMKPHLPKPHPTTESKKIGLETSKPTKNKEVEGRTSMEHTPTESSAAESLPPSPKPVSHSLSHVNMDDLVDKMEVEKLVLFLEIKKGFSMTFDLPVDDPIDPAPSYTDFFNLAELPIKRLVKLAKSLSPFHKLTQDDQIALLKGSVVAVVTIRSAKLFDASKMGWNVTRGGKAMDLSSMSLLTSNPDGAKFFQYYVTFVKNLVSVSKSDDGIMMMLIVLSVFDPNLDNITSKQEVLAIRKQYTEVLQQYIEIKYPNEEGMFDSVIGQLDRITEVRIMHSSALQKTPPNKLEPLIVEIFDVSNYGKI